MSEVAGPARPFCRRLVGPADPLAAVPLLRGRPGAVALSGEWAGGGLVLSSHPLLTADETADPFVLLERGAPFAVEATEDATDIVIGGAWMGWLGFQLAGEIEQLPPVPPRPQPLPRFQLAFHDHLVRCDAQGQWWFEALWTEGRATVIEAAFVHWMSELGAAAHARGPRPSGSARESGERAGRSGEAGLARATLRVQPPGAAGHAVAVAEAVERIAAGDLSQVNVCLRAEGTLSGELLEIWTTGVAASRPSHAAYFAGAGGGHAVASLSPELFLRRTGRRVQTRPIKGTAPRDSDPERLRTSVKDRAENLMIVDLMRNDLGRVCAYGTVRATALCEVEPAAGVWHLVSTVEGTLREAVGDGALLRATFPPGSVTGAPKIQALQLIHRLEPTAREVFCGAHGFVSPLSGLELGVAIRTLELRGDAVWLGAGGGIVSDSEPSAELDEALAKAAGVTRACGLQLTVEDDEAALVAPVATEPRPDPARGVFETMLARDGAIRALDAHLDRLARSCAALGLNLDRAEAHAAVDAAAAEMGTGAVRLAVDAAGMAVTTRPLPPPGATTLIPVVLPGGLGPHKWNDRGLIDTLSRPGVTPLLCDLDGEVLEAGYAAVLLVRGETLVAPPLDRRRLDSVSRAQTLAAARALGIEVVTERVTLAQARNADGIVLSSSLRGPHPGRLEDGPGMERAAALCARLSGA